MIFLLLGVIDFLYVFFCFENQVHLLHISPFLPEFLERSLKRTAKSPWKYRKILKRHFHLNQPLIFKGKELLVSGREKFPTEKCSPNTKKNKRRPVSSGPSARRKSACKFKYCFRVWMPNHICPFELRPVGSGGGVFWSVPKGEILLLRTKFTKVFA